MVFTMPVNGSRAGDVALCCARGRAMALARCYQLAFVICLLFLKSYYSNILLLLI